MDNERCTTSDAQRAMHNKRLLLLLLLRFRAQKWVGRPVAHGSRRAINGTVALSHGGRLPTEKCAILHAYRIKNDVSTNLGFSLLVLFKVVSDGGRHVTYSMQCNDCLVASCDTDAAVISGLPFVIAHRHTVSLTVSPTVRLLLQLHARPPCSW